MIKLRDYLDVNIVLLLIVLSLFNWKVNSSQASDFYVHNLPLLSKSFSSIHMHAGYLPADPQHHGALFFWHFAKKSITKKSTTVIWLAGGPGGSSIPQVWLGVGPLLFRNNNTIVENKRSWSLFANLLFVDQPVGTSFSYTDANAFIHDLPEMADQFLYFLDRYIEIFPRLLDHDIYFAGSSFAGQYIPYIARTILEKRSALKLRGLLIGNGLIDPRTTYMSYLPFAVEKQMIERDSALYNRTSEKVKECQEALSKKVHVFENKCDHILRQIVYDSPDTDYYAKKYKYKCLNVYNLHLADTVADCSVNRWPKQKDITSYLRRPDVLACLHVGAKVLNWTYYSHSVYEAFDACHSTPSVELLPDLLRRIPIVLYNGEYDVICNYRATETMIDMMSWNGRTGFDLGNGTFAPTESWIVEGESAGVIRSARNLTYILFYKAGHTVTYDQTSRSRAMLQQFIKRNSNRNQDQTIKKKTKRNSQTKHRSSKRIAFLTLATTAPVVVFLSLVWFMVYKRQLSRTPFDIIRTLQSKFRGVERQQSVIYSLLNDSPEDLHIPNNVTLV